MTPSHAIAVVIPECGINFVKNLSHKILGAFGGVNMNLSARYVVYRVVIRNVGYFIIVNRLFAYKRRSAMRTYRGLFDGSISSTPSAIRAFSRY